MYIALVKWVQSGSVAEELEERVVAVVLGGWGRGEERVRGRRRG